MKTGTMLTATVHYLRPRQFNGKTELMPICTNARNLKAWAFETGQPVTCKRCLAAHAADTSKNTGPQKLTISN